jgi:hypothetical protein
MISNRKIEATVTGFVDAFFTDAGGEKIPVRAVLLESESAQVEEGAKKPLDPLSIRHDRGELICTLHLAGLAEVPEAALQGWVDMALAKAFMERDSHRYHLNFSRQILPLFPVSGSAVNFIRYIVECLSRGLKRYIATKTLITMGHGPLQAHFLFFKMYFPREDVSTCRMVAPHLWTKAVFLCRRLETYMALWVLSRHDVAFSFRLQEAWNQAHEYLTLEDKAFLHEIGSIPERKPGTSYADNMVEMFLTVRDRYLHRTLNPLEGKSES